MESPRCPHLYSPRRPFCSPSALDPQLVALFAAPSLKGDSTLGRHSAAPGSRLPAPGSRPSPRHFSSPPRVFPPLHPQDLRRSDLALCHHSRLLTFALNVGH